jgi:sugar/nucleoside kinase (ribokinase family)
MNTFLGAAQNLTADDIDPEVITASAITYMEGYLWDPPSAKEAFLKAAKIAHGAGRIVALTLSDTFCVDRYRPEFQKLVAGDVDLLFANESEILSLYETTNFDDAVARLKSECKYGAVTRSEKGAVVLHEGEVFEIAADKIDKIVDTTGAGDLFAAGFMYGFARDFTPTRCGQLGAMAAAEIISHYGPRPMVSLKDLAAQKGL